MMFLGIDPSLNSTGWAVLDYDTGERVATGLITPHPDDGTGLVGRLDLIEGAVCELMEILEGMAEASDEQLDWAIEEGVAFRSGKVTRDLAAAWGVIAVHAYQHIGVEPYLANVSEVKRLATGRGNAPKVDVTAAAVSRWGERVYQSDIADACWVAEAGRQNLQDQMRRMAARNN